MPDAKRYKVQAVDARGRTVTGINYPPNNLRAAAGSVVDDIPQVSINSLLARGVIAETTEPLRRLDDTKGKAVAFSAPVDTKAAPQPAPPAPEPEHLPPSEPEPTPAKED